VTGDGGIQNKGQLGNLSQSKCSNQAVSIQLPTGILFEKVED
jgi:hypothetical protein